MRMMLLVLLITIPAMLMAQSEETELWKPFRYFEGCWKGQLWVVSERTGQPHVMRYNII